VIERGEFAPRFQPFGQARITKPLMKRIHIGSQVSRDKLQNLRMVIVKQASTRPDCNPSVEPIHEGEVSPLPDGEEGLGRLLLDTSSAWSTERMRYLVVWLLGLAHGEQPHHRMLCAKISLPQ
jgi:hypothetical protein